MASAQTYTPIATTTLASNTASYTFSSIPQTYTDLILEATGATDYTAGTSWPFYIQVGNGLVDIGSNYSDTMLYGNGSSALAHRDSGNTVLYFGEFPANTGGTNRFELSTIHFMNYSNTSTYKTALARLNNTTNFIFATVGLWRSTAAINTIKIFAASPQNLLAGTTLTLYGIASA